MSYGVADGVRRMLDLVGTLPDQLRASAGFPGLAEAVNHTAGANDVLLCGMGGSAIAADLLRPLVGNGRLDVWRDYGLPSWTTPDTLVVLSSYSGETEEVLSSAAEAKALGCRRVAVSSGGALSGLYTDQPVIVLPSGLPPRASLGYGLGGLLHLLRGLDMLRPGIASPEMVADELARREPELGPSAGEASAAYGLAVALARRMTVIHTTAVENHAVGRRWRAQILENAKQFAVCTEYPELNHNEIEGWRASDPSTRALVVLRSPVEHPRIARRAAVTTTLLEPSFASSTSVQGTGDDPLTRLMSLVQFGDYVSCYIASIVDVDPVPVPLISELKALLQEGDRS